MALNIYGAKIYGIEIFMKLKFYGTPRFEENRILKYMIKGLC